MSDQPKCALCGHPMPKGEEMFHYHGYSGPCPGPPLPKIEIETRQPYLPPEDVETLQGVARELMDGGEQPAWSAMVLGKQLRAILAKLEAK